MDFKPCALRPSVFGGRRRLITVPMMSSLALVPRWSPGFPAWWIANHYYIGEGQEADVLLTDVRQRSETAQAARTKLMEDYGADALILSWKGTPVGLGFRQEQRIPYRTEGGRLYENGKDAVRICSLIVSSDSAFFEKLSPEETRRFFEESKSFLTEFVGPENVISIMVHMDEKTPHMHFLHIPITREGRLSAKTIYTRESLKKL